MNAEEFEQVSELLQKDPKEAENQLEPFLSDPQSISFFLAIIANPPSEKSKNAALTLIKNSISKNYSNLDQESRDQIEHSLIELSFADENNFTKLYPLLFAQIKDDPAKCVQLIEMAEKFLSEGNFVLTSLEFLENLILCFDENAAEILSPHFETFLAISLNYLQTKDETVNWPFIISSMRIFFYTIALIPPENKVVYPHYEFIFNQFPDDKNTFASYWRIIKDAISIDLIPDDYVAKLYTLIMETVGQNQIDYNQKNLLIYVLTDLIPKFNEEQLAQLLNAVFTASYEFVEHENIIPVDYFSTIRQALKNLPRDCVYSMIKERVLHFVEAGDRSGLVISIYLFSLVLEYAPDSAYKDSEFIMTTLMQALDTQDPLLSTSVCEVLETFSRSFNSISIFTIQFIPRIIPFLVSEDDDLRQKANDALDTLTNQINIPLEGFFHSLWELREGIPSEDYSSYLKFLAVAVEKSDDFGDQETEALKAFTLPPLMNLEDIDTASNFLPLVSNLICQNEALLQELLEPALAVVMNCINNDDSSEDSVVNCFDFTCIILKKFGAKVAESFKPAIDKGLELLKDIDEKNEEQEAQESEPEAVTARIKSIALDACCLFTKKTEDQGLASKLQEYCIEFFTRDYDEDQDSEEDGDDIEEIEEDAINQASESCQLIIKLLDAEDKRQLFVNILEYLKQTTNPTCASYSIQPLIKILHNADDEEQRQFFLVQCFGIIQMIMNDELPALDQNILSGNCDFLLMTNISYLLCEVIRNKSEYVDQLCQFMIQIITNSLNSAYLYCFIGAYSDVIKYGTGSDEANQAIINMLPTLFQEAHDPDTKQNLAYLLIIIVQKNPQALASLGDFIVIMQQWYVEGKENPNGYQLMLSNIASAYLTFFANGLEINPDLLNEALSEFPPFDTHETESMLLNMAKIFSTANAPLSSLEFAALALAKFFILNEEDLKKRKITPELWGVAQQFFKTIAASNPEIVQNALNKYQNSQVKLAKLAAVLS